MFRRVRRGVAPTLAVAALLVGCGASIPEHSGYKSDKAKPWKKPKVLTLDDKLEAKYEDDLSYAEFRRARWLAVDLPMPGDLRLSLEASPAPPYDDEDFDLAMELYDGSGDLLVTADLDSDDAHE
ncbi:MAG: hypothetical protein R2939_17405, partial [Kofleriaceae bacterium]